MKKNKLIFDPKEIIGILGKKYEKLSTIFSDKMGIINVILKRYELEEYGLKMYQCLSADTKVLFNLSRDVSSGGLGISNSEKGAIISCIAEAVERYCMSYVPEKELEKLYWKEIKDDEKITDYQLYTDNQYEQNPQFFNPKKEQIYWTKINSIDSNKQIYWPASLIYLPFELSKTVAETSSTGMAAGYSLNDCILSGLLELIERDSLMINFSKRLNPPEIDIDTLNGENSDFVNKINEKYKVKIYKLYSDIKVPTYLCFIWTGEGKKIHYGIGASTNLDSDEAINKALKECLFTYYYSLNIMDLRKSESEEISTLYEHFLYYQGELFEELLFKSKKVKYVKEKYTFEELKENLRLQGLEAYYKELTTEDVKQTELKVVKVIVPGLIDLNKTHSMQRLAAKRFEDVPNKLGLQTITGLAKQPHPFP